MKKQPVVNLIRVSFANHFSFEKKQTVFFEQDTKYSSSSDEWNLIRRGKTVILPVTVFYGANGSGKSNLMIVFDKLKTFLDRSKRVSSKIYGYRPFRLNDKSAQKESLLELDMIVDKQSVTYSLRFTGTEITYENLVVDHKKMYSKNKNRINFVDATLSEYVKSEILDTLKRRKDILLLELLAIQEYPIYTKLYNVFKYSFQHFKNVADDDTLKENLYSNKKLCAKISQWLLAADIGISRFEVTRTLIPESKKRIKREIFERLRGLPELHMDDELDDNATKQYEYHLNFYHRGENNKEYVLSDRDESRGTLLFLCMLVALYPAFIQGGLFFDDELDSALHPLLVKILIQAFNNPRINKGGAQLICTTHDVNLLHCDVLRRDEVWFVEKDFYGHSSVYPLSQFNDVRKNSDYWKAYLGGKYGAVPLLGQLLDFEKLMEE